MIESKDPRLSAYALDELAPSEVQEMDRAFQTQPELLAEVEQFRWLADELEHAFDQEPLPVKTHVSAGFGRTRTSSGFIANTSKISQKRSLWRFFTRNTDGTAVDNGTDYANLKAGTDLKSGTNMKWRFVRGALIASIVLFSGVVLLTWLVPENTLLPTRSDGTALVSYPIEDSEFEPLTDIDSLQYRNDPKSGSMSDPFSVSPSESLSYEDYSASFLDWGPVEPWSIPNYSDASSVPAQNVNMHHPGSSQDRPQLAVNRNNSGNADTVEIDSANTPSLTEQRLAQATPSAALHSRVENPFSSAANQPYSQFGVQKNTDSYVYMRDYVRKNRALPPAESVRVEEYLNYFEFAMDVPTPTEETPVQASVEVGKHPWLDGLLLAKIGLQGRSITDETRPAMNLVFLVDVSGSMHASNRLPLVQQSLSNLTAQLRTEDRIAIVTYSSAVEMNLPPTSGAEKQTILKSIGNLAAWNAAHGSGGLETAYQLAQKSFIPQAVNQIILCTDGNFRIGSTKPEQLESIASSRSEQGIGLTIIGFGMDNCRDELIPRLAQAGMGHYAYIDTSEQALRVLGDQLDQTLFDVANDFQLQLDFNPNTVAYYRLIGYEQRAEKDRDYLDQQKNATKISSGLNLIALYEIVPVGVENPFAQAASPVRGRSEELYEELLSAFEPCYEYVSYDGSFASESTCDVSVSSDEAFSGSTTTDSTTTGSNTTDSKNTASKNSDSKSSDSKSSGSKSSDSKNSGSTDTVISASISSDTPVRTDELFVLKYRFRLPNDYQTRYERIPVEKPSEDLAVETAQKPEFRFAAAVALYAQILRKSQYIGSAGFTTVLELSEGAENGNPKRKEFTELVEVLSQFE